MIERLETLQKQMKIASLDVKNTPKKYRDFAAKEYVKITKDLDKIYAAYSKIYLMEEKIVKKFGINCEEN